VLGIKEQVNLPGTINEYPNWRLRPPVYLEDLGNEISLLTLAKTMNAAGRSVKRIASRR